MHWKCTVNPDGSIFTVEYAGPQKEDGRRVFYVEAETKAEATALAKVKAKEWRERQRNYTRKKKVEAKIKGLCIRCRAVKSRPGKTNCVFCAERYAETYRQKKAGTFVRKTPKYNSDIEAMNAEKLRLKSHSGHGVAQLAAYRKCLAQYESNPKTFKGWLLTEIARLESKIEERRLRLTAVAPE